MTKSAKRTKNDPQWVELVKRVKERDRGCRLLPLLTPQEFLLLRKNAGSRLLHCDPCHVFPVGAHPELCYDIENIVYLNRYSHDNLDNCKSPITGNPITREERDLWWARIVGEEFYFRLRDKVYNKV